ncbi:hypothetical protein WA538_006100 [Blastocystis sp. DL]
MNEKFALCKEVHRSFVSNPKYFAFRSPVNWKEMNLPDYPIIIKQPMDLGTIDRRLKKEYYKTPAEYVTDMRLVYHNCMTYNAEGSELYEIGKQFMEEFESKVTDLHLLDFAFRLSALKTKQRIDQFLREMESTSKEVKDCCLNVLRIVCPECIVYIDETHVNISTDKMSPDALDYILEFLVSMKSE